MLRSTISCRARLTGTIKQARDRISSFPALEPISRGSTISYSVVDKPGGNVVGILELSAIEIRLSYFYDRPNDKDAALNTSRFLCMLAILDGIYQPDLSSIYRSIISILVSVSNAYSDILDDRDNSAYRLRQKLKELGDINFSLAKKNLELEHQMRSQAGGFKAATEAMELISYKIVDARPDSKQFKEWMGNIGAGADLLYQFDKLWRRA